MGIAFPGESAEYRAARDQLLGLEIELHRSMEAVAAARRALPPGGLIPEDYIFQGGEADGTRAEVRLSELFAPGKDSLVIYNFMFPRDPRDTRPGRTPVRRRCSHSPRGRARRVWRFWISSTAQPNTLRRSSTSR